MTLDDFLPHSAFELFLVLTLWIMWIEYHIGMVLIRPDSSGQMMLNLRSLFHFASSPLRETWLWVSPLLWLDNVFIFVTLVFVIRGVVTKLLIECVLEYVDSLWGGRNN